MSQKIQNDAKKRRIESDALNDWKRDVNRDDRTLQEIMKDARTVYNNKMANKGKKKVNMKRVMKNLKYGSGYVKGLKGKQKHRNTYSSTNAFESDWRRSK